MWSSWALVVVALAGVCGQPSWEFSRARHGLAKLSDSDADALCRLTNWTRLNEYLDRLLIKRVSGTAGAKKAWSFLRSSLLRLGFHVETDEFVDLTPYGNRTFRNIMGTWNPSAPRRLVLACHYDSKFFDRFEFLAATDSAFPCAAMLEIGAGLRPWLWSGADVDLSLQLLFFDGEEAFKEWTATDSIYGARHLAEKWEGEVYVTGDSARSTLNRIDVLLLLDLLGAPRPTIHNMDMGAGKYFQGLIEAEEDLARRGCLRLHKRRLREDRRIFLPNRLPGSHVEDDHVPFLHRRVPVLHAIPLPFPSVWHKAGDNRQALHEDTMRDLIAIFRTFVARYLQLSGFADRSPM